MSDADKAGLQARSPEGHAAKGMRIQGQEEVWIRIQHDTFKNWVNVTLREDAVNASLNDNHYRGGSSGNIMRGDEQPVRIDFVVRISRTGFFYFKAPRNLSFLYDSFNF